MKSSTTDKVQGAARQAKGKVKEVAGKATKNRSLQAEGAAEKVAGKAQRKAHEVIGDRSDDPRAGARDSNHPPSPFKARAAKAAQC